MQMKNIKGQSAGLRGIQFWIGEPREKWGSALTLRVQLLRKLIIRDTNWLSAVQYSNLRYSGIYEIQTGAFLNSVMLACKTIPSVKSRILFS